MEETVQTHPVSGFGRKISSILDTYLSEYVYGDIYYLAFSDPHEQTYIERYVHACSLKCLATCPTCPAIAFMTCNRLCVPLFPVLTICGKQKYNI